MHSRFWAWAIILTVLIVIAGSFGYVSYTNSERSLTTTVRFKERTCSTKGNDCKYLLYTEAGTFELTDTLLYRRFDTSDVYGRINEGSRYKLRVVGWRQGFLSIYPNVLEATEVASG